MGVKIDLEQQELTKLLYLEYLKKEEEYRERLINAIKNTEWKEQQKNNSSAYSLSEMQQNFTDKGDFKLKGEFDKEDVEYFRGLVSILEKKNGEYVISLVKKEDVEDEESIIINWEDITPIRATTDDVDGIFAKAREMVRSNIEKAIVADRQRNKNDNSIEKNREHKKDDIEIEKNGVEIKIDESAEENSELESFIIKENSKNEKDEEELENEIETPLTPEERNRKILAMVEEEEIVEVKSSEQPSSSEKNNIKEAQDASEEASLENFVEKTPQGEEVKQEEDAKQEEDKSSLEDYIEENPPETPFSSEPSLSESPIEKSIFHGEEVSEKQNFNNFKETVHDMVSDKNNTMLYLPAIAANEPSVKAEKEVKEDNNLTLMTR